MKMNLVLSVTILLCAHEITCKGITIKQYGMNPKIIVKPSSQQMENVPSKIFLSADEVMEDFDKTSFGKRLRKLMLTYKLVQPTLCQLYKSPFGCCWDNKTIAFGVSGEGCPECIDKKESCSKWKDFCHIQEIRQVCPQSCDVCPKPKTNCENSTLQDNDSYCRLYVKFGLCKHDRINSYCKKSCSGCN